MSINEQVENLRRIAKEWNPDTPINPVSVTLNQAADTIGIPISKAARGEYGAVSGGLRRVDSM